MQPWQRAQMTHMRPIQSERPLADWLGSMNTMQKLGLLQIPVVSDAAGLLGDIQQYRDEPESRNLLNYSMTGLGLLPLFPAMTVFHGSPHKWLPEAEFPMGRPRLDKIGTGEGNQAFGYGMYFAETPEVARSYSSAGKAAYQNSRVAEMAFRALDANSGDRKKAISWLHKRYLDAPTEYRQLYQDAVNNFDDVTKDASLYTLDLPDERLPDLLDWDKPLSQQPEAVRKAIIDEVKQQNIDVFEYPSLAAVIGKHPRDKTFVPTGEQIFNELSDLKGKHRNSQDAADYLKALGIPGLRYLDAGSRGMSGAGRWQMTLPNGKTQVFDFKPNDDIVAQLGGKLEPIGTSNFVIWDQELLDEMARRMANMKGNK